MVFAADLEAALFSRRQGISHRPYETFIDIILTAASTPLTPSLHIHKSDGLCDKLILQKEMINCTIVVMFVKCC